MIDDANLSREGERRKVAILMLAKQTGQRRRDRHVATRWGIMLMFCAGAFCSLASRDHRNSAIRAARSGTSATNEGTSSSDRQ